MKCPRCSVSKTKVIDSRTAREGKVIRRRRLCLSCSERFTTYEEAELIRLLVIKRNGRRDVYDQSKIIAGVQKAFEKRSITEKKFDDIIRNIEYKIFSKDATEIKSREIGRIILQQLRQVDEVAYLRFLSVYQAFQSVERFRKEVEKIHNKE